VDRRMPLRKSHENPEVQAIYKEFYGEPCSEKSHHLLHTIYFDKKIKFDID
jgi:iron only hydrogenase large subunit-like protein